MRLEANHTAGYVGIGFGPTNTTKMGGTDYYVAYKPSGSNCTLLYYDAIIEHFPP